MAAPARDASTCRRGRARCRARWRGAPPGGRTSTRNRGPPLNSGASWWLSRSGTVAQTRLSSEVAQGLVSRFLIVPTLTPARRASSACGMRRSSRRARRRRPICRQTVRGDLVAGCAMWPILTAAVLDSSPHIGCKCALWAGAGRGGPPRGVCFTSLQLSGHFIGRWPRTPSTAIKMTIKLQRLETARQRTAAAALGACLRLRRRRTTSRPSRSRCPRTRPRR